MFGHFALNSRLFVVICAAAALFIMCLPAAKAASPMMATGYIRIKNNFLTRLNAPHSQQTPLSVALPSKESGVQTATDTRGNSRDTSSISNHQSHPVPYTKGSFSFGQINQDNKQPRVRITKVQSGGGKLASNIFSRGSLHGGNGLSGWRSRKPVYSVPQKEENVRDSYNLNDLSQNWGNKYTKKSNHEENVPTSDPSGVDGDTSLGNSLHSHLFPSQLDRVQSARLLIPVKHYGDYKEANQLPTVKVESGLNGRNQVHHFRSYSAPHGASLSRRNPNQEKQTSVTDFSQNQISVRKGEMLGLHKVQSYHFKDSLTQSNEVMGGGLEGTQMDAAKYEQNPFDEQEKIRYGSGFKQPLRVKQGNFGQKQSLIKHQIRIYPSQHVTTSPPKTHFHPVAVEEKNPEGFVPPVHLNSKDGYPSKTFVPLDQENSTSRDLVQHYKPQQSIQRLSRLRGFTNSVKQPVRESSPSGRSHSHQSSLDKGVNYRFKFANTFSYLNPKYSFGPREPATTTTPAEPKTTAGSDSPVPVIQALSSPRPPTTRFKPSKVLNPETKDGMNRNATQMRVLLYKGRFDLKGFGTQPLEGAKALPQEPEVSTKPDFKGFKLRSLQTWRPKPIRIHRRYNQAGETKSSTNNITMGMSNDESKPLPKTASGNLSLPRSTSDNTTNKTQTSQILRPIKGGSPPVQSKSNWRHSDQDPATSPQIISSSYLRSGGRLKAALKPESETSEANKNKPVANMITFQTSTSSTVRGIRVKETSNRKLNRFIIINATRNAAIIRQLGVKAVTYADILGSASFSSIRAKSFAPTEEEYFPNVTTMEQNGGLNFKSDDGNNTSTSLKGNDVIEQEDFQGVEKDKFGNGEDNEVKTSGLFLDNEGSGSGDFDLANVLSTVKESQAAGKDLLELDYLRKATENVFFKSVRHTQLDLP